MKYKKEHSRRDKSHHHLKSLSLLSSHHGTHLPMHLLLLKLLMPLSHANHTAPQTLKTTMISMHATAFQSTAELLLSRIPKRHICLLLGGLYLIAAGILNYEKALPLLVLVWLALGFLAIRLLWRRLLHTKNVAASPRMMAELETLQDHNADQRCPSAMEELDNAIGIKSDEHKSQSMMQDLPDGFIVGSKWFRYPMIMCGVVAAVMFCIYILAASWLRVVSLAGMLGFILISYFASTDRARINWRTVSWGFMLQFVFALIILKTDPGFQFFQKMGEIVSEMLETSDAGAIFIFGEDFKEHFFAFKVLSSIVFFSALVSIFYHFGWVQAAIRAIAYVMMISMRTSGVESLVCAANTFSGQSESVMLVKPYLPTMTKSELHVVMTSGFATIAGGIMASYMSFGISASHLIAASVMSAPAALAISKILYPETGAPLTMSLSALDEWDCKSPYMNFIDAAVAGTTAGLVLAANVGSMALSFRGLLELVNVSLIYFGSLLNIEDFTFDLIMGYLFIPFALMMGVEPKDAVAVGKLLGKKLILSEFLAYLDLKEYMENYDLVQSGQVSEGSVEYISERSQVEISISFSLSISYYPIRIEIILSFGHLCALHYMILWAAEKLPMIKADLAYVLQTIAVYALCGFSNLTSIGVQIGAISSVCPERREDAIQIAFRALAAGTFACFMTATIVGMMT